MIVVEQEGAFQLVTQPEHAHLSARVLELFRSPPVRQRRYYDELLFATREHDNGWQELDSAPSWNKDRSRPYDFLTMPTTERVELWQRGARRFLASHPYASTLVMHHAWHLHTKEPLLETQRSQDKGDQQRSDPISADPISAMVRELAELRDQTLAELEIELDQLKSDYFYLELADLISLAICCQWQRVFELSGRHDSFRFELVELETDRGAARLEIDPFPLVGTTTFRYRARSIGKRDFRGDTELAVALMSSPSNEVTVKLCPKSTL